MSETLCEDTRGKKKTGTKLAASTDYVTINLDVRFISRIFSNKLLLSK